MAHSRTVWSFATALAAVMLTGCAERVGTVSGHVRYKGAPLTAGVIAFHVGSPQRVVPGVIHADGTYAVENVPVGEATLTVAAPPRTAPAGFRHMPPAELERLRKQSGTTVALTPPPAHYARTGESGLHCEIQPGTQEFDIELHD